jgi:hypothetical protein
MNTSRPHWCVVLDRGGGDGGEASREVEGFAFREDNAQAGGDLGGNFCEELRGGIVCGLSASCPGQFPAILRQ